MFTNHSNHHLSTSLGGAVNCSPLETLTPVIDIIKK